MPSIHAHSARKLCSAVLAALFGIVTHADTAVADQKPASSPSALTVTAAVVKNTQLSRTVVANGSIYAWQEMIVGPEVGGYRVAAVNVDVGDHVRRGQELVRLSASLLTSEVNSKLAALKQAQAQLVNAQAAYRRADSLSSSGVFTKADLDRLQSEELAADAHMQAARADLEGSQLRVQYTHVLAPDDGVVTSRSVTIGQVAAAGSEMLRLLRKGRLEWRGDVPEARLRELKVGQQATLETADGEKLTGKVRIVAPTVQNSNRTGTVYVDISSPGTARPGMFARGSVETSRSAANMVPLGSIVMQDGYSYLFVLQNDMTVQRRKVATGIVQGGDVEVLGGLNPNDRVVAKGAGFLKDGDHVAVSGG
jgi:RND family efflux transporter MFP subunit